MAHVPKPSRVDSFADAGAGVPTESGAPRLPGAGRSWYDVFGTSTTTMSSPPMPPMPWEDAAAAPAPSWTAPLERFLSSAAASLASAASPPPPPPRPRPRTVDFTSAPSHYTTLGVAPSATHAEVRAAYRRLALAHHPDRNENGEERMARINSSFAVLDSPRTRRKYDYDLRYGRFDGGRRRGAPG